MPDWIISFTEKEIIIKNFYLGGGYGTLFLAIEKISKKNLTLLKENKISPSLREYIYKKALK